MNTKGKHVKMPKRNAAKVRNGKRNPAVNASQRRKRLPNGMNPIATAVNLPQDLRELFAEVAHETNKTFSYTVVVFIRENLERG